MPAARRLLTNFSKGELSPLIECRPDLAAYFEGGKTIENWYLLRQGGLTRRPGSRFVAEVKFPERDTVLLPFEFSVSDAFILEFGDEYIRFFKNNIPIRISAGADPYEIESPYIAADLRAIHFTQSADVVFLFHPSYQQRRLSRISDTNWVLTPIVHRPPPSFEADTDISDGVTAGGGVVGPTSCVMTLPLDGAVIVNSAPVTCTATATDAEGIAQVEFLVGFEGTGYEFSVGADATSPYSVVFETIQYSSIPQILTVRAVATNIAGQQRSSAKIRIQVSGMGG